MFKIQHGPSCKLAIWVARSVKACLRTRTSPKIASSPVWRHALLPPRNNGEHTKKGITCPIDDAHVDWQGGGRVRACYDDAFTDPGKPKSWYKLNHSCRPNAALRMENNRICFFSLRCIPKGEHITFRYSQQHSDFPNAWCDCEPKSAHEPRGRDV